MRVTSGGRGGHRPLRHTLAVLMIAGTALAVAACGSTASATKSAGPEKKNLTVAAVPGEGAAGLYIAQEKGLFGKQGLHVTIQTVTSSSTVIPAMLHGSVDVASGQYTSYITAAAAGIAKMRILAAGYSLGPHVQEVIVPAHSDIRTLADLKGKTIAVNAPNSETTDLLYTALSSYGSQSRPGPPRRHPVSGNVRRAGRRPGERGVRDRAVPDRGGEEVRRPGTGRHRYRGDPGFPDRGLWRAGLLGR